MCFARLRPRVEVAHTQLGRSLLAAMYWFGWRIGAMKVHAMSLLENARALELPRGMFLFFI
jgi:hypothetical protein